MVKIVNCCVLMLLIFCFLVDTWSPLPPTILSGTLGTAVLGTWDVLLTRFLSSFKSSCTINFWHFIVFFEVVIDAWLLFSTDSLHQWSSRNIWDAVGTVGPALGPSSSFRGSYPSNIPILSLSILVLKWHKANGVYFCPRVV